MRSFALFLLLCCAPFTALASTGAADEAELDLLSFTQLGFTEDEAAMLQQRLRQEAREDGAALRTLDPPMSRECLDDAACRATALADRLGGVAVELTRIGPLVQVRITILGPDGAVVHGSDQSVPADAFLDEGALFDETSHERLRELVATAPKPGPADEPTVSANGSDAQGEGGMQRWMPAVLGLTGLATTVVGLFTAAGFSSIAASQAGVLNDATSLGTDKEAARVFGIVSLVGVGLGMAVSAAGLGMAGTAVYFESTAAPPPASPEPATVEYVDDEGGDGLGLDGMGESGAEGEGEAPTEGDAEDALEFGADDDGAATEADATEQTPPDAQPE